MKLKEIPPVLDRHYPLVLILLGLIVLVLAGGSSIGLGSYSIALSGQVGAVISTILVLAGVLLFLIGVMSILQRLGAGGRLATTFILATFLVATVALLFHDFYIDDAKSVVEPNPLASWDFDSSRNIATATVIKGYLEKHNGRSLILVTRRQNKTIPFQSDTNIDISSKYPLRGPFKGEFDLEVKAVNTARNIEYGDAIEFGLISVREDANLTDRRMVANILESGGELLDHVGAPYKPNLSKGETLVSLYERASSANQLRVKAEICSN